jgi:hypothetical protein
MLISKSIPQLIEMDAINPRSGKTISVCPNHKMCFSVHLPYNSKLLVNS